MKLIHLVIAVIAVSVAGLATGIAIGGKETTKTVYVDRAVPSSPEPPEEPGSEPETTPSDEPGGAADPSAEEPATEPQYLDSLPVSTDQEDFSEINLSESAPLQDGKNYDFSTTFRLESMDFNGHDFWAFEIPVPDGKTHFKADIGFTKGVSSKHRVEVSFVANELPTGETVRKAEELSATDTARVNIGLDGVRTLIVKIRPAIDSWDYWDSPTFVLGGARFE